MIFFLSQTGDYDRANHAHAFDEDGKTTTMRHILIFFLEVAQFNLNFGRTDQRDELFV